jgi:hypothetical protein
MIKIIFICFAIIFTCSCGCGVIKGSSNKTIDMVIDEANEHYPKDNIFEDKLEDVIESTTTLDTDFSP